MKKVTLVVLALLFTCCLSAQNMAANAPLLGVHANTLFFMGNNHHANDLQTIPGFSFSLRYDLNRFGINFQFGNNRMNIREDAVLFTNWTQVQNNIYALYLGYNLFEEFDLLEPRISFGQINTRYAHSFKTNQRFLGTGLKYARCVSKWGLFISASADFFFNISQNIDAPQAYMQFMNQKRGVQLNLGLEYRLFKNR
jgi:hypothetical protein